MFENEHTCNRKPAAHPGQPGSDPRRKGTFSRQHSSLQRKFVAVFGLSQNESFLPKMASHN